MAEKTKATEAVAEEREDIFIPRGMANDDPNFYVFHNGKPYVMPRGKTSNVPKHVADEIRRIWRAEEKRITKSDELLEMGKEPIYKI